MRRTNYRNLAWVEGCTESGFHIQQGEVSLEPLRSPWESTYLRQVDLNLPLLFLSSSFVWFWQEQFCFANHQPPGNQAEKQGFQLLSLPQPWLSLLGFFFLNYFEKYLNISPCTFNYEALTLARSDESELSHLQHSGSWDKSTATSLRPVWTTQWAPTSPA